MALTTFKRIHTATRGTSTYRAEGFPGVILMAKPAFNGVHPDFIEVADVPEAVAKATRAGLAGKTEEEKTALKQAAADKREAAKKAKAAAKAVAKAAAFQKKADEANERARALAEGAPAAVEATA